MRDSPNGDTGTNLRATIADGNHSTKSDGTTNMDATATNANDHAHPATRKQM